MNNKIRKAQELEETKKKESGQTFVEFLFLLLSIMSLSYVLLRGINSGIGTRWVVLIKAISAPTTDSIELR